MSPKQVNGVLNLCKKCGAQKATIHARQDYYCQCVTKKIVWRRK